MNIKNKEKQILGIQEEIKKKELELSQDPTKIQIQAEIKISQQQLQSILEDEIQKNIRFMVQKYFEGADKLGNFLLALIKKRIRASITQFNVNNKIITNHHGLKDSFMKFKLIYIKKNCRY